jgi:hypothetical protein
MPNHVTSVVSVSGPEADIEQFAVKHLPEGGLDFNTVIPCPASVKATTSGTMAELWYHALTGRFQPKGRWTNTSLREFGCVPNEIENPLQLHAWLLENHASSKAEGEAAIASIEETGFADWYEWNCHHWGTKWNAYSQSVKDRQPGLLRIQFDTAWSFPEPIFNRLAEIWPRLVFDVKSFDEGWNFACTGQFNGRCDYATVKATNELYESVYGHPFEQEQDTPVGWFLAGRTYRTLYGARMACTARALPASMIVRA